jgi:hypothetical protein
MKVQEHFDSLKKVLDKNPEVGNFPLFKLYLADGHDDAHFEVDIGSHIRPAFKDKNGYIHMDKEGYEKYNNSEPFVINVMVL